MKNVLFLLLIATSCKVAHIPRYESKEPYCEVRVKTSKRNYKKYYCVSYIAMNGKKYEFVDSDGFVRSTKISKSSIINLNEESLKK